MKLLLTQKVAPAWLLEECRLDSETDTRELIEKASAKTLAFESNAEEMDELRANMRELRNLDSELNALFNQATRDNPRWVHVDVKFVKKTRLVPLTELRTHRQLAKMPLLQRGNRLSILPGLAEPNHATENCRYHAWLAFPKGL